VRQHQLIDAVLAVNEAPTLTGAFQVLAETGLDLLGADHLWVVVWSGDLATGEVAATAGGATAWRGEQVPSDAHSIESISTGEPYAGPPILDGLSPELAAKFSDVATIVRVPLLTESCRATFHAAWEAPLSGAEATEAAHLLHTLTRLTTVAERTLREREQDQLANVLNGVAGGVGPSAAGFAFDLSHSYPLPIMASAGTNIAAAVVVCIEPNWANRIAEGIAKTGKPVEVFSIERHGDLSTLARAARTPATARVNANTATSRARSYW